MNAPLSPTAQKMLRELEAKRGQFVPGRALAEAMEIGMERLSGYAAELRRKRPDINFLSRHGKGYGLDAPAPAGTEPKRASQSGSYAREARYRDVLQLLAGLSPASAELVRHAALDTGQNAQSALERLIQYGWEVHRDLIAQGENPLLLRRAA